LTDTLYNVVDTCYNNYLTERGVKMPKNKKSKPKLNRVNQARRNAEASALEVILREIHRGSAFGIQQDQRTKRNRTRDAQKRNALQDWN
jgi:hypothetical protein